MIIQYRRLSLAQFRAFCIFLASVGVGVGVAYGLRAQVECCEVERQEPTLEVNLAEDIDVTGQWTGFQAFFRSSSVLIKKDGNNAGMYRLLFIRDTDLGVWHFKRRATLANGVLTLNKPVSESGFAGSRSPYRVLYAVRTGHGKFLVPSVNAETMKSANDLVPGFAYQRSGDASDAALGRFAMGTWRDEAIEEITEIVPVIIREKLKAVPLLFELSFGPACWLATKTNYLNLRAVAAVYEPLIHAALDNKVWYGRSLRSYFLALSDRGRGANDLVMMLLALIPDEVIRIDSGRD